MTDSKTPDWVKDEARKLAKEAVREAFRDPLMPMTVPMEPMLAQAIFAADQRGYERGRKEGIEEAAKVLNEGFERPGIKTKHDTCPHNLYGWQDCEQCAEAAIRQLLEVKG